MEIILDTTFLVDLEKSTQGKKISSDPYAFLKDHSMDQLEISVISAGEFAYGFGEAGFFNDYVKSFFVHPIDLEIAWIYGQNARKLRGKGQMIGSNDLWIACTALRHGRPVATKNKNEFLRIEGLEVLDY